MLRKLNLVVLALMVAVTGVHLTAGAATLSVCASGCAFTSVQEAVAAASAGDVIQLGAGVFVGPVRVDKSLTIRGVGAAASVIGGGLIVGGLNLVVNVEDLTLTQGLNGLTVLGVSAVTARRVVIAENIADGVVVGDLSSLRMYNAQVLDNGMVVLGNPIGAGVSIFGAASLQTFDVTISGNASAGITAFGKARLDLGLLTQVTGNGLGEIIPGLGGEGLILAGRSSTTMDGVLVQGNGASGIAVRENAQATIENSQVLENKGVGIRIGGPASVNPDIEASAEATVRNTVIARNGSHGVLVGDPVKELETATATLIGNGIRDNGGYGVWIDSGATVTLRLNWISGNAQGDVFP